MVAFFPVHSPREMNEAVQKINRELRSQYVLGYSPSANPELKGKWHKLKVHLNREPHEVEPSGLCAQGLLRGQRLALHNSHCAFVISAFGRNRQRISGANFFRLSRDDLVL